jgi:tetratricopeptide (TPR) repeat protein
MKAVEINKVYMLASNSSYLASLFVFLLLFASLTSPVFAEEVKGDATLPEALSPADYNSLLSDGVIKLNQNNLADAIHLFEQAIAQDAKGVEAYYYIGVAQARMNLVKEAEKSFQSALTLDPLFIPAHFDLGILYYQNKSNDEAALASFEMVQKADPDRARVYFYQGLILRRLGKFKEAAYKLEEAAQRDPALSQEAYHQAGEAYYQANDLDGSKRVLQKVIALTPKSIAAKEAEAFLKNLDIPEIAQSKGSPFGFSLLTGLLYDDNVILEPQGTASQTDDWVDFLRLRGRYQFTQNRSAEYSFYQNYHADSLRDYDIQDHNLSLNVRPLRFEDRLNVGYQFQVALLGNKHYLTYNTLGTQYAYSKSDTKVTELSYKFQVKRYHNINPRFPTSEYRNALSHQIGIRHAVLLDADINLRGAYFFEHDRAGDSASQDDWSLTGHHLKSGITLPAWHKLTTAIDLEYIFRPYEHKNEFSAGTKRRDHGHLLNMRLSRPFGEHVQVVFSYFYQRNHSNIATFDYNRSVYGILAIARF